MLWCWWLWIWICWNWETRQKSTVLGIITTTAVITQSVSSVIFRVRLCLRTTRISSFAALKLAHCGWRPSYDCLQRRGVDSVQLVTISYAIQMIILIHYPPENQPSDARTAVNNQESRPCVLWRACNDESPSLINYPRLVQYAAHTLHIWT